MSGRTDTERLDWLEQWDKIEVAPFQNRNGTGVQMVAGENFMLAETIRDCIDAAMDAEERG